jgi:hypothetical protein
MIIFIVGFKIFDFKEPKISLEKYKIEDGFELSVIASESFFKAPVAMDFDNKGRMWVVEMIGYMPNIEGVGDIVKRPRARYRACVKQEVCLGRKMLPPSERPLLRCVCT